MQDISLFMSGAHGDVYAVFDYAPDTVLLTKSRGEDAQYEDDEAEGEGESGFARWSTRDTTDTRGDEAIDESESEMGIREGSPTVPEPRGRTDKPSSPDIGMPRSNTIVTDSILSTSPQHPRRVTSGKGPKLHFDERRRTSQPITETSPAGSGQSEQELQQSPLEMIYPSGPTMQSTSNRASGHIGIGRRPSLDLRGIAEETAPQWVRGLGEMLRRMEERQERIEGMLKMAPGEGE